DHTLSDLIGFAYGSWDSREAAADLIRRLREIGARLRTAPASFSSAPPGPPVATPLVTIALDGENAWEYYPRDGRDFLQYLYEGLSTEPSLRCVTISEHLGESPAVRSLDWLHTGSWIGGDLRTWSGDKAHNIAWDLLHDARDLAARRRSPLGGGPHPSDVQQAPAITSDAPQGAGSDTEAAWRHVMIAEGSDWFWWFGDHHHTELDHVWDSHFRLQLQEVYRRLGEPVPAGLLFPILEPSESSRATLPRHVLAPIIDGIATDPAEWEGAGSLALDLPSTMQRSETTEIDTVRFGWQVDSLCLLVVPGVSTALSGLEIELHMAGSGPDGDLVVRMALEENGGVGVSCSQRPALSDATEAVWKEVLEVKLPLGPSSAGTDEHTGMVPSGLVVRIGRGGMVDHVFHSARLDSLGWGGS
ncbi:MAG: hypothetical protein JW990_10405, partial [Thermoleophilia bacterium]|nr:hypothetical protein [Thermoleophilia bacterium]